jgi:hypothetical protein
LVRILGEGHTGWLYQVENNGQKEPFWFWLGDTPIRKPNGESVYPVYYSIDEKKFYRIRTPDGTSRKLQDG